MVGDGTGVGAGGGFVTGATPGAIPRAMAVRTSTRPVAGVRPRAAWKADTAAAVPAPKMPSTPPRTGIPAVTRAF